MTKETLNAGEMALSLNGFDEMAIAMRFGRPWKELGESDQSMLLRALLFVHERRAGKKDDLAFKTAMGVTVADLGERFVDAEEEVDPDDPVTDLGKGSTPDA